MATLVAFVGLLWHIDPGSVLTAAIGEVVTLLLAPLLVLGIILLALYLVDRAAKSVARPSHQNNSSAGVAWFLCS